jgi:hypothetical protein
MAEQLQGPFEKFVYWRHCAPVKQMEAKQRLAAASPRTFQTVLVCFYGKQEATLKTSRTECWVTKSTAMAVFVLVAVTQERQVLTTLHRVWRLMSIIWEIYSLVNEVIKNT